MMAHSRNAPQEQVVIPRYRLLIDKPVQSAILFRALWYWGICLVAQLLMAFFFASAASSSNGYSTDDPRMWWHLQLTFLAAVVLLPIILLDVLKLSHRWVGPIFRVRNTLRSLGKGENVSPVKFREHDFWQDLAGDLNAVSDELSRRRNHPSPEKSA